MKTDDSANLCLWCLEKIENVSICPHCGHSQDTVFYEKQYLQPGTYLNHDHYLVGRVLGAGGFGVTYLMLDRETGAKVAVKEYYPGNLVYRSDDRSVRVFSTEREDAFQKGLKSFRKEVLSLKKCGAHPNIVKIYDSFEENNTAYYVMEYLDGVSFETYLKSCGGKLSWRESLQILNPIGDALSSLHAMGIIHRDVKPDNIFITGEGKSVLFDFGSAWYDASDERSGLTPGYAPVEQYGSKYQGTWTDVYAFASTFYRAVSGVIPPVSTDRSIEDTLIPLKNLIPEIPLEVSDAVHSAMAVNYADRTQTIDSFLSSLNRFLLSDDKNVREPVSTGNIENQPYKSHLTDWLFRDSDRTIFRTIPNTPGLNVLSKFSVLIGSFLESAGQPNCGTLSKNSPQDEQGTKLSVQSDTNAHKDDRTSKDAESALPENTLLDRRYRIIKFIGRDNSCMNYLVYDNVQKINRVIKEYYPLGLRQGEEISRLEKTVQESVSETYRKGMDLFSRKMEAFARVGSHPNLMQVFNTFQENNTAYSVIEAVEGMTFLQYLETRGGSISWDKALQILKPVGAGISLLHKNHLLHRAVSPNNIIITRSGTPKLIGFGASRHEASAICTALCSLSAYAPIEQYGSRYQGVYMDVYSLAAVYYRAVSGIVPIPASERRIEDSLQPLDKAVCEVPHRVSKAVRHAMAVSFAGRTQNMSQFLEELGEVPQPSAYHIPVATRARNVISKAIRKQNEIKPKSSKVYRPIHERFGNVITEAMRKAQVGDHLFYGSYPQNNSCPGVNEPIEWRVVQRKENALLLVCEYGLEARSYHTKAGAITWDKCELREWLNHDFYRNAFSAAERERISVTHFKVPKIPEYGVKPGNDTWDKVFLLNVQEADAFFRNDSDRRCRVTAYAAANKAILDQRNGGTGWWWLRSAGFLSGYISCVTSSGHIMTYGSVGEKQQGVVRPAFWLNL